MAAGFESQDGTRQHLRHVGPAGCGSVTTFPVDPVRRAEPTEPRRRYCVHCRVGVLDEEWADVTEGDR